MLKISHIIVLALFCLAVIGVVYILAKVSYKPEVPPIDRVEYFITTSIDSVKFEMEIRAKIMAELKPAVKTKTKIIYEKVSVDSIYAEAKKRFESETNGDFGLYDYIADFDTTLAVQDTSGKVTDEVSIHGQYVSPIPLAEGKFRLFFEHKSRTATVHLHETIVEEIPTKFGFGIQATGGYELTKGRIGTIIGVGVHYQTKTLLPFGWLPCLGHGFQITGGYDPVMKDYGVAIGYGVHLDIFGG
jgi:hypothetical protein